MLRKSRTDLLVVGAGPVGLFAALAAANRGLNVRIIDREWHTAAHSYALALHPTTFELLEVEGVAGPVLSEARRIRHIALADHKGVRTTIPIASLGDDFSFISVIRQDVLERALEKALAKRGVRVMWRHEASLIREADDHVNVRIDRLDVESRGYGIEHSETIVSNTHTMEVAFVIGADGMGSDVRQSLDIEFEEVGSGSNFAVFEFATDANLGDTMTIVLENGLTNVLWPMPDGFCRWSFELPDEDIRPTRRTKDRYVTEEADRVSATLSEYDLVQFLDERAPWFKGSVDELTWRKAVRFDRKMASPFGKRRVWLAGDAAHTTGPGGVHSMNIGLQEAARLVNLMIEVCRERMPLSSLEAYDEERWLEWRMLLGSDPVKASDAADGWISEHADRIVANLPLSGHSLDAALGHLGLNTVRSSLPAT